MFNILYRKQHIMENSVNIMIRVRELLGQHIKNERTPDYDKIVELVCDYINNNCVHSVIMDSIDIDAERSQTIYYCEKCEKTFDGFPQKK